MRNLGWLCVGSMLGLLAACGSASSGGNADNLFGNGGSATGGSAGTPVGTGAGTSVGGGSGGGLNIDAGMGGGGNTTSNNCVSGADEDKDQDDFSVNAGDCNDCDANVNPGAIDVYSDGTDGGAPQWGDEDCDGTPGSSALADCDANLALDDLDPMSAARTIELCRTTTATDKTWGVISSAWVRADGTPHPGPAATVGLTPDFGPNVHPQAGANMLGISSGNARTPAQPAACGSLSCSSLLTPVSPPAGFPQDVPTCPGLLNINDDVALEVKLRAPTNATGYSFNFRFYSFEYPEWVCTSYNDQFIALVSPQPAGSINGNISFDSQTNPVSVNVGFFDVCAGCPAGTNDLVGTGFDIWDDAGATSWLQTQAPVEPGSEVTIRFAIWDTGDSAWDSTALIDNFKWVADGGTVSVGTTPVPIPR